MIIVSLHDKAMKSFVKSLTLSLRRRSVISPIGLSVNGGLNRLFTS
jgi:hypothetical protein